MSVDAADAARRADAKRETDATVTIANLTWVLAAVGILQGGVLLWQGWLIRGEFNATHRAKIIVRSIRPQLEGVATSPVGQRLMMSYELANIGDTHAEIVATTLSIAFVQAGPLQMPRAPKVGEFAGGYTTRRLDAGEFTDAWYGNPETAFRDEMFSGAPLSRGFFFCGHIFYKDRSNTVRRTSFCRRYDAERGYWPVAQYYDYDHAD